MSLIQIEKWMKFDTETNELVFDDWTRIETKIDNDPVIQEWLKEFHDILDK